MVLRSMTAASLILLLTVFVQNPYQLLVLRLIHGCFSGFVSSAVALIAAETPEKSLGTGLGIFQSTITGGFIIGPFFGGVLQDYLGIRTAILMGSILVFLGSLIVFFFVKENNKPKSTHKKYTVWNNAEYLFKNEPLWPAARIQFLSNLSLMSVQPILALFVIFLLPASNDRIGTMSGLVISASALSMMMGAPFWGRMADKWSQKKVLMLCLIFSGISFIPQAFAQSVGQLYFGRFLLGFFAAGIAPSLQALIAHHSPQERRAGILGVSFSITLMGNAVGPLLGGALAASVGFRFPFLATSCILFTAALMTRSLKVRLIKAPASTLTHAD